MFLPCQQGDNAQNWRTSASAGRALLAIALLPATVLLVGCGEKWGQVYPVSGIVKFDNQTPVGANIVLHPVNPAGPDVVAPTAQVKSDGSFVVSTYQAGDGAPAGEYVVTVTWFKVDAEGMAGPNVIPKEYACRDSSPIKVTVNAGPTPLEPIHIAGGAKTARGPARPAAR